MSFSTAAGANYWQQAKAGTMFVQTGRPFTIMAWVNLSSTATRWAVIASTYDGTANSWEFGAVGGVGANGWATDTPYLFWSTSDIFYGYNQVGMAAFTSTPLSTNIWYHLCFRYGLNGAYQFDEVRDGRVVGATGTTGGDVIINGQRKLWLHQSTDEPNIGIPGRTACIRMFEGCLSLSEIEENRRSILCPPSMRYKNLFDLPGIGRTEFAPPVDMGPKNLGHFTRVGTVSTSHDPPVFVRPRKRRIWNVPAAGRTTKNTRSHPLGIRSGINWRVVG